MKHNKKLIEVALPLEAINVASAREKSIRHGHPSTLHLWWARRPLAAARAVIFAQMVDDPSSHPDIFRTEKAQEKERQRLFRIIEDLVLWENTTNETVLQQARDEIWQSWRYTCAENADHPLAKEFFNRHKLPAFHDPFAGGGSLPLEAQRLGLEVYASDLNPVAVLINKAMIEIPPKFAGRSPVNPEVRTSFLGAPASSPALSESSSWRSRGYIPHFDQPDLIQSITFRLHDAVPETVVDQWKRELAWVENLPAIDPRQIALRKRIDKYEDAGHGACWLRDERVAALVEQALLHFDGDRYRIIAWCIMPNHVHAIVETREGYPLAGLLHSWKSYTAHEGNKLLHRSGEFWFREYHDRFMRDGEHLANAVEYIENNPVKAGLVGEKEEWKWSSASRRENAGGTPALPGGLPGFWRGAQGLAEDVRYYGKWMRDEAEKRIGHLYPKIEITSEMVAGSAGVSPARPDLKPYVGRKLTVIAWLWARTVKSPNPAFAQVDVPLASTFMLSTKSGKEAYVEPVITGGAAVPGGQHAGEDAGAPSYRFTVKVGKPKDAEAAKNGTKLARANFVCLMSGTPISGDYIKGEGKAGRMGARLMAIVAEGNRGRVYLEPTPEHEAAAQGAEPTWRPDGQIAARMTGGNCTPYGLTSWGDLFTARQLVTLTTFSDLVQEGRERVKRDALAAGLPDDGNPLCEGGSGAAAYADAVAVYLGLVVSKQTIFLVTQARWRAGEGKSAPAFGRQALPMVWDFADLNPFAGAGGDFLGIVEGAEKTIQNNPPPVIGNAYQADAATQTFSTDRIVSTDPPYYDNIGYADLSDYFYVWLRRSLKAVFPDLFATLVVPKAEELVATPYRHGSKAQAEAFFLNGMTQAMQRLAEQAHPAFPVTIYYAFKQTETPGRPFLMQLSAPVLLSAAPGRCARRIRRGWLAWLPTPSSPASSSFAARAWPIRPLPPAASLSVRSRPSCP